MNSVLVLEDDPALQAIYQRAFSFESFEVDVASDAAVALMKLESKTYDVITIDLMMPGMSGLDFLTTFRQTYPSSTSKIIVLSNIDNPAIVDKVKALVIDGYFVKSNQEPQAVVAFAKSLLSGPTLV